MSDFVEGMRSPVDSSSYAQLSTLIFHDRMKDLI